MSACRLSSSRGSLLLGRVCCSELTGVGFEFVNGDPAVPHGVDIWPFGKTLVLAKATHLFAMNTARYSSFLLATFLLIACGSETLEDKVNRRLGEAVNSAVEQASGTEVNEQQLRDVLDEAGRSLDSLKFDKLSDVEVIGFRDLKPLMPSSVAGLSRTEHLGETNGVMGLEISQASAVYGTGERRVEAKLLDTGGAGMLLLSMASFSKLKVDKETADGSERTFTLDGYPAYEKYSSKGGRVTSSLSVLVKDRFVVTLEGTGVDAEALSMGFRQFQLSPLPDAK